MSEKSNLNFFIALAILATTFLLYSQTLGFDFVNWDDDVYLYENFRLYPVSLENVAWFFSHAYYYSYIPVTMLSHMADVALWQLNPSGHHLTNVILHALNTTWVFLLALQIFLIVKNGLSVRGVRELLFVECDRTIVLGALAAAIFYAWHPLRVESVAWISDRKDLLCTFFLLPATIGYVNYAASKGTGNAPRWYVPSYVLFILACLSKPIAVTLPVVFLLLDWMLLRSTRTSRLRDLLKEKVPFVLVSAIIALVALRVTPPPASSDMFQILSPVQRGLLPFSNAVTYFYATFVPVNLSPIYPLPGTPMMALNFAIFAAITLFTLWFWKKGRLMPLLAWMIYIVMITPSAGFSTAVMQTTADRYAYLPSVALFLFIGGMVGEVARSVALQKLHWTSLVVTAILLAAFLGFLNMRQQHTWENSESLWGRAVALFPEMPLPYNNIGLALQSRGAMDRAEEAYTRAIRLKPEYVEARVNLANIMFAKGNLEMAEQLLLRAAELNPQQAEVFNNLGVVASSKGNTSDALRWFRKSVEVNPEYAQGYFNLGALYARMGNHDAAVDALKSAARLGHVAARQSLGKEKIPW